LVAHFRQAQPAMAEVHLSLVRGNEPESGAEATALQTLARPLDITELREAFGLRRVYRRFSYGGNEIFLRCSRSQNATLIRAAIRSQIVTGSPNHQRQALISQFATASGMEHYEQPNVIARGRHWIVDPHNARTKSYSRL
jgi:hypothetical protein